MRALIPTYKLTLSAYEVSAVKVDKAKRKVILAEVKQVSSENREIALTYVYGSFVGEVAFRDLDLAVVLTTSVTPYEEGKLCGVLAREIEGRIKPRIEVDIRAVNSAPPHFQFEVIRSGRLVFARTEHERVEFEEEVLTNYLDYQDTLKWFEQQLIAEK
jgi:predicted nucleotidyltransferase